VNADVDGEILLTVGFSIRHRLYVRKQFSKLCKRRFRCKYPGVRVPAASTIFKLVKKVRSSGSSLDNNYTRKNVVLTEVVRTQVKAGLNNA
jgi:hypothetical protein